MVSLGANDYNEALRIVCTFYQGIFRSCACDYKNNTLDIIKYLVHLGANDYNTASKNTCNFDNIKYLISIGADNYNDILENICLNCVHDKTDKIIYLISLGANNYNTALKLLCCGEDLDIIKYLVNLGADNYNEGLLNTKKLSIIMYLISIGANDFDGAFEQACRYRWIDAINYYYIEKKVRSVNRALLSACKSVYNNLFIIKHLIKSWKANNLEEAFIVSSENFGKDEILNYLYSLGVNPIRIIIKIIYGIYTVKYNTDFHVLIKYSGIIRKNCHKGYKYNYFSVFKQIIDGNLIDLQEAFILAYNAGKEYYCIYILERGIIIKNTTLLKNYKLKQLLDLSGINSDSLEKKDN
jgi:hypothetical protein